MLSALALPIRPLMICKLIGLKLAIYIIFVFKGIQPKDIKNLTIPPDIIPSGQSFSREISPLKLIAREPLAGKGRNAGKITPGLIPNGESGILLFVKQNDTPIKEKMAVKITEKTLQ
jgi:hypothetical protein